MEKKSNKERKFQVIMFRGIEQNYPLKNLNGFLLMHEIKKVTYIETGNIITAIVEYYYDDYVEEYF